MTMRSLVRTLFLAALVSTWPGVPAHADTSGVEAVSGTEAGAFAISRPQALREEVVEPIGLLLLGGGLLAIGRRLRGRRSADV
jgi:hypothetical protein